MIGHPQKGVLSEVEILTMNRTRILYFSLLAIFTSSANATDFFYRLGFNWRPSFTLYDIDPSDDYADIDNPSGFVGANGAISYKLGESDRIYFTFLFDTLELEGSYQDNDQCRNTKCDYYEEIDMTQFGLTYQHHFVITQNFGLWLGGGLTMTNLSYQSRYASTLVDGIDRSLSPRPGIETEDTSLPGIRLEVESGTYEPFRYTGVSLYSTYDQVLGDEGFGAISAGLNVKYGIF